MAEQLSGLSRKAASCPPEGDCLLYNHSSKRGEGVEKQEKLEKLKRRLPSSVPLLFARLVYLASLRDYNTDRYAHAGWAFELTEEGADHALRQFHHQEFQQLLRLSLPALTEELQAYFESLPEPSADVLSVWKKLESFRALVPLGCHPVDRELFLSNVRAALGVLGGSGIPSLLPQSASPPPSPAR